jgi:flagellar assembly factor FliW
MIKIETRDFGSLEIENENIITFPNGVYAFETSTSYALISPLGESTYPMWLQCTQDISPCFIVFDPTAIDEGFRITLTESEKKLLKVTDESELQCLVIASVPEDYRGTTVNMKSPVVINPKERLGAQIILPFDYPFRLPLYANEKELKP